MRGHVVGLCPALVGVQTVLPPTCRCSGGEHAYLLPHMSSLCLKARTGLMCPRPSPSPAVHSSIHSVNMFWDPSGHGPLGSEMRVRSEEDRVPSAVSRGGREWQGYPTTCQVQEGSRRGRVRLGLGGMLLDHQSERGKRQK